MELLENFSWDDIKQLDLDSSSGSESLGAWFLGVKGENAKLFTELITKAISSHICERESNYPSDPPWITEEVTSNPHFKESVAFLEKEFEIVLEKLRSSVPFSSYRYQAHMLWDVTMPALLGYFSAMLYNQNNVAAEASPVTTWLEILVGDDLCKMLGYHISDRAYDEETKQIYLNKKNENEISAWGHITCDGSVANTEAMWAARNLKFYPLAVATALISEPNLYSAIGLTVSTADGQVLPLVELDDWQILNIKVDDILMLTQRMISEYGISKDDLEKINSYTLQNLGFSALIKRFPNVAYENIVIMSSATSHYSWPKSAALIGIGSSNVIKIKVDLNARLSLKDLRIQLDYCLKTKTPVVMVVGVLGTTEESAIDPIADIITLRDEYRQCGLEFYVHVDAAWGGYFASLLREPHEKSFAFKLKSNFSAHTENLSKAQQQQLRIFTPEIAMSEYVNEQYRAIKHADSITIDPHKAGYIPYPAGGLCYRNSSMRNLVSFTAPVVYHGGIDPTVGVYGVEGSKPGAAAAATYLSHRVIKTDQSGYGRILGRCLFNSKRLYAELVTMASDNDAFIIVPIQRLPAERHNRSKDYIKRERDYIKEKFVPLENYELWELLEKEPNDMTLFSELGSDQVIISYSFNFKVDGKLNTDVTKMNELNKKLFERLSLGRYHKEKKERELSVPLIVTASQFDPEIYGAEFVQSFMKRLGVVGDPVLPIEFLISTTMDPWLTDTADGNFIPILIKALRVEVNSVINELY